MHPTRPRENHVTSPLRLATCDHAHATSQGRMALKNTRKCNPLVTSTYTLYVFVKVTRPETRLQHW